MQHVVSQLITKKSELQGQLEYYKRQVKTIEQALEGINVSIKVFTPEFDLSTVKSTNFTGNKHIFKKGEAVRHTFDLLRKEGSPKTTSDITKYLMIMKQLDPEDQELRNNVQKSVLTSLKKQEKEGRLSSSMEKGVNGTLWSLSN